jgi:hypothetical protein
MLLKQGNGEMLRSLSRIAIFIRGGCLVPLFFYELEVASQADLFHGSYLERVSLENRSMCYN